MLLLSRYSSSVSTHFWCNSFNVLYHFIIVSSFRGRKMIGTSGLSSGRYRIVIKYAPRVNKLQSEATYQLTDPEVHIHPEHHECIIVP